MQSVDRCCWVSRVTLFGQACIDFYNRGPKKSPVRTPGTESRRMSKILKAAALSFAAAAAVTTMIGCNVGDPAPFDPRTLGESERLASRDTRTYSMHPLPTTLQSPYLDDTQK